MGQQRLGPHPRRVLAAANLAVDQAVDVREDAGRIIIEPIRDTGYDLAALIAAIIQDNLHAPPDVGAPRGHESW